MLKFITQSIGQGDCGTQLECIRCKEVVVGCGKELIPGATTRVECLREGGPMLSKRIRIEGEGNGIVKGNAEPGRIPSSRPPPNTRDLREAAG